MTSPTRAITYGVPFDVPMTLENRGGLPVFHYDDVLAFLRSAAPQSLVEGPGEDDEPFSRLSQGIALPGTSYVVREYANPDDGNPLVLVVPGDGSSLPGTEEVRALEAYVASHSKSPKRLARHLTT